MPLESYAPDHLYSQKEDEFEKESKKFSIVRSIQGLVNGRLSGRELEIQQELSRKNGRSSQGIFVPSESWQQRDYVKGTATAGGNLVGTHSFTR